MFGQFSTCDLVEFQRLLWSGQQQQQQQQQQQGQQPQYINNQQQTIITGIQQQTGSVIATNTNSVVVQSSNNMPVQRQQNFLNQPSVSFTTQPTTRYIPNQPQSRAVNHSSIPHGTILIQQQQPQTQTLFSQSQAFPLDLGKQTQEARIREMVPEFEEQYFMQSSPTKVTAGRGNQNQGAVQRPQSHIPTSQAISDHLARSYPQQDLIRQKMVQDQEAQHRSKHPKKSRHEIYQAAMVELEVDNHADDDDYEEEEEEDDSEEEYEEYEPSGDAGPWKCGVCHKVYKRKVNFLEHQKTHKQAGGSKIQCAVPLCTKVFANDKTYQRHLKSQHPHQQINATPCPGRKSKSKRDQLQAAISSISGGSGGTQQQYYQPGMMFMFKCDFCPEQFAYAEQLKAHEQMHLAESTLKCVTCEQPFLREEEFNQHIKTHLTETIWKCALCNTSYDEYKAYKVHLDSHLPVVYKDPPPKPPELEKPERTEEIKNGVDDDIVMMEEFEDEGSPQPSTSAAAKLKSPSKYKNESLARPPMKNFGPNKAKYATGSNMKVTTKGASAREVIVKPGPKLVGKGFDGPIEGEDDDIVVLSAPKTPHRPIPIRVPPIIRKMPSGGIGKGLPPMKHNLNQRKHRSSAPITANRKQPTHANKSKRKSSPHPKQRQRGRPKSMPATKFLVIDEDVPYQFQCILCKTFFPTKPARQKHILDRHCSQKSIEIKLLKLEDDPELDLEVIEDEEGILPDP